MSWYERTSDLLREPDLGATPFLVDSLLVDGSMGVLQGAHKVGKTWLVLELALSIVTGKPALGRFAIDQPGPVLLVLEESGRAAYHRRMDRLSRGRAIRPEALDELYFAANRGVRLNDFEWQKRLLEAADELKPRAVFLDPLARLKGPGVDENSQREIGAILDYLRLLRDHGGGTVVYVHHVGHEGTRQRGSSDLEAWWESKLELQLKDDVAQLAASHREAERSPVISYRSLFDVETETVRLLAEDDGASERVRRYVERLEEWETVEEIAKDVELRAATVREILKVLVEEPAPVVVKRKGPPGRHANAVCYVSSQIAGRDGTTPTPMPLSVSSPDTPYRGSGRDGKASRPENRDDTGADRP